MKMPCSTIGGSVSQVYVWGLMTCITVMWIPGQACPDACTCLGKLTLCNSMNLTTIPRGIPLSTERLFLNGNRISHLGPGMLDYLPNLKELMLSDNMIRTVDLGVLTKAVFLESLFIARNQIGSKVSVHNLLCSIHSKVGVALDLTDALEEGMELDQWTFTCLQNIFISDLYITNVQLHPAVFSGASIDVLDLDSVFHESFNPAVFRGIVYLKYLILRRNLLSLLPRFSENGTSILPTLEMLTVQEDYSTTLYLHRITGLPALKTLELVSNTKRLGGSYYIEVYPDTFSRLPLLQNLTMSDAIVYDSDGRVDVCLFKSNSIILVELFMYFALSAISTPTFSCLPSLKFLYLVYGKPPRTERATRIFRTGLQNCTNLLLLDIGSNDLGQLWSGMFTGLPSLIRLYLHDNRLALWPPGIFDSLHSLKALYLSDNLLKTIEPWMFPSTDFLISLDWLFISGNPFSCTCDLYWFTRFLPNINGSFIDRERTVCATPRSLSGKRIIDYKPTHEDCFADFLPITFHLVTAVSAACGFALLVFAVTHRHRWYLQSWIFQMKAKRTRYDLLNEEDVHYKYDAFVSYNYSDITWLRKEFLPAVEVKMKFRVCLHDRDWTAGPSIVDNIIDSLINSIKVILILTNAFMRSQWCQLEMTLAQHHLFEQDRNSLILVILEPIHKYNMTPRLALQMRTHTYIEWTENRAGKELFFKKLERAIGKRQTSIRMQLMAETVL